MSVSSGSADVLIGRASDGTAAARGAIAAPTRAAPSMRDTRAAARMFGRRMVAKIASRDYRE